MDQQKILYKYYKGSDGLKSLQSSWKALVDIDDASELLHSYEWLLSYLEALSDDPESLIFYCAYINEKLVAIFPLILKKTKIYGISISTLCFPNHSHITLHDFVMASTYRVKANVVNGLISALRNEAEIKWDFIVFSSVIEGSNTQTQIDHERMPLTIKISIDNSYSIDCSETYEQTVSHIPGNFRRNIARLERKAIKQGELGFKSIKLSDDTYDEYIKQFIDIEDDSWKGDNKSSIKSSDVFINYYHALKRNFNDDNPCVINFLTQNGELIAGQFAILYKNRLNLLKIGFRSKYSNIGPGNILLSYTLKDCIDNSNCTNVNIITAPKWADKWKNNSKPVFTYYIFNKTARGIACYYFYKCLPFIKKTLTNIKQYVQTSEKSIK